jgi:hypothetical protein
VTYIRIVLVLLPMVVLYYMDTHINMFHSHLNKVVDIANHHHRFEIYLMQHHMLYYRSHTYSCLGIHNNHYICSPTVVNNHIYTIHCLLYFLFDILHDLLHLYNSHNHFHYIHNLVDTHNNYPVSTHHNFATY